ncbi:MAG TPA: GldM family protein [Bacteroidia bacterium]|nr:GldM family protein [Bacteroidia bacterium]
MNNAFLRILLFIGFFCASGLLTAQKGCVVHSIENSTLYKGCPNRLSIGLKGIAADSIEVSAVNATVEKQNIWSWTVVPDTAYQRLTVIVKAWNKRKLVSVDSMIFRLVWLPDPVIYIANKTGHNDSIQRSVLAEALGFSARGMGIDQDAPYQVISFGMRLDDGSAQFHLAEGAFLTADMKEVILAVKPGTRAFFEHVIVRYPDGRVKTLDGVTLLLK